MKKIIFVFVALAVNTSLFGKPPIDTNIHRIVFLGNSITYAGNYIVDMEAWFITHYPKQNIEFINVGLPSETVSGLSEEGHAGGAFPRPDLHERLQRVLAATKPDLVFACYGMNDGIYLPFDKERFQKFKEGVTWMHDMVVKLGAKIIHVTPPVYDELKGGSIGYANTLDRYSDWIIQQKKINKWEVADLHYSMKAFLDAHRKVDSIYHLSGFAYADDGVHPNETGHWVMAKSILLYLGEKEVSLVPDIKTAMVKYKNGIQILKLVTERQELMKDAWLTATGHKRPGIKQGLPLEEAKAKAASIGEQIKKQLNT